jgi:hypothetical protein
MQRDEKVYRSGCNGMRKYPEGNAVHLEGDGTGGHWSVEKVMRFGPVFEKKKLRGSWQKCLYLRGIFLINYKFEKLQLRLRKRLTKVHLYFLMAVRYMYCMYNCTYMYLNEFLPLRLPPPSLTSTYVTPSPPPPIRPLTNLSSPFTDL